MHAPDDNGFPLSQVANSLKPYLKTRQEVLRIRRVLTVFLTSLLIDSATAKSWSLLSIVPEQQCHDPKIPPEVSGLRKDYLKARQANLRATREARAAASGEQEPAGWNSRLNPSAWSNSAADDTGDSLMQDYLALLQQRQRFEKLRILQDYMDVLLTKPAAKPSYLDVRNIELDAHSAPSMQQLPASRIPPQELSKSGGLSTTVDELMIRLEKAVIRTKHNLELEQRLLADLRVRQQTSCASSDTDRLARSQPTSRFYALNRTREELIGWIERELAQTDSPPDQGQHEEETMDKRHQITNTSVQLRLDIEGHYADYVQARKRCLALVADATSPLSSAPSDNSPLPSHMHELRSETDGSTCCSGLLDLFTRLHVPLSHQKSLAQQKSFIAGNLAKEQEATMEALNRLANESHLIPEYPLLTADKRFQNVAAALGSKPPALQVGPATADSTQGTTLLMARRWAFAASAAKSSAQEVVNEKITSCCNHTGTAQVVLSDVRTLLGHSMIQAGAEDEDEDLWVPSVSAKAKSSKQLTSLGHKSIWHELRGEISSVKQSV